MILWWNLIPALTFAIQVSAQSQCGPPPLNVNLIIEDKYVKKTVYNHEDKVVYKCSLGYQQKSGVRSIQCKDGTWSSLTMECERRSCGSAGDLLYGRFEQAGALFGDEVSATCNDGYVLKGNRTRVCGNAGWSGEVPSCEEVRCPDPSVPNGVKLSGEGPVYRFQHSAKFSCKEGYRLNGSNTITCGQKGQWIPSIPKCLPIKCLLLNISNARYSNHRKYGVVVNISCKKGFKLSGPNQVQCTEKKTWRPNVPKCLPVREASRPSEITCPSPSVANGVKTSSDIQVYRVRDSVTFACREGFLLSGHQEVTCGLNGQWQPQLPKCLPIPSSGKCGQPPHHRNAYPADNYITQSEFPPGARIRYICELGYARAGGSSFSRCVGGRWTPLTMTCERKSCGSAGEITNGQFVYEGVLYGETAKAVCHKGHRLVGEGQRTCTNNGWDGRIPVCEVVQCDEPPEVSGAVMTGTVEPPFKYGSVVSYRCLRGTLIGNREIFCTENSRWNEPPPMCRGA